MNDVIGKENILALMRMEHDELVEAIQQIDQSLWERPFSPGEWTIKDTLAHLTSWEIKMRQWLEETLRGEIPSRPAYSFTQEELDWMNAEIYAENKDKPLGTVRSAFEDSYLLSLKTVEAISEDDLLDPDRFAWREGNPLWHMVAANTFWHYQEHLENLGKNMINLYNQSTNTLIGTISQNQLQFLIDQLEEEFPEDHDYSITGMELAYFEGQGVDPELLRMLRQALGGQDELIIRWSRL